LGGGGGGAPPPPPPPGGWSGYSIISQLRPQAWHSLFFCPQRRQSQYVHQIHLK